LKGNRAVCECSSRPELGRSTPLLLLRPRAVPPPRRVHSPRRSAPALDPPRRARTAAPHAIARPRSSASPPSPRAPPSCIDRSLPLLAFAPPLRVRADGRPRPSSTRLGARAALHVASAAEPIDSMRSWPCGTATRPRSGILCVSPLGGVVRTADGVTERSGAPPPPQPSPPCRPRRCL
jgi:hypothetical protein